MRHFFLFLTLIYSSLTFADYTSSDIYYRVGSVTQIASNHYATHIIACNAAKTQMDITGGYGPYTITNSGEPNCVLQYYNSTNTVNKPSSKWKTCNGVEYSYGASPGAGLCSGTAPPPDPCLALAGIYLYKSLFAPASATSLCYSGCVVVDKSALSVCTSTECRGDKFQYTGASCTPTNSAPPATPEQKCLDAGKSYGYVNGAAVCVPKSTTGATPTTTKQSTSSTTNNINNSTNTSTSSSSTSSISYNSSTGSVEKTENQVGADGVSHTITTSQDVGSFCSENPASPICKEASDVCTDHPDRIGCQDLGTPTDTDVFTNNSIDVSNLTPVTMMSSPSCPAPKTMVIAGKTLSISFSWLCSYASIMKPLIIAFAYLSAGIMIFKFGVN